MKLHKYRLYWGVDWHTDIFAPNAASALCGLWDILGDIVPVRMIIHAATNKVVRL